MNLKRCVCSEFRARWSKTECAGDVAFRREKGWGRIDCGMKEARASS